MTSSDKSSSVVFAVFDTSSKFCQLLTPFAFSSKSNFKNKDHFYVDLSDIQQVSNFSRKIKKLTFDVFIYYPGNFYPKQITGLDTAQIIEQFNRPTLESFRQYRMIRIGKGLTTYLPSFIPFQPLFINQQSHQFRNCN